MFSLTNFIFSPLFPVIFTAIEESIGFFFQFHSKYLFFKTGFVTHIMQTIAFKKYKIVRSNFERRNTELLLRFARIGRLCVFHFNYFVPFFFYNNSLTFTKREYVQLKNCINLSRHLLLILHYFSVVRFRYFFVRKFLIYFKRLLLKRASTKLGMKFKFSGVVFKKRIIVTNIL